MIFIVAVEEGWTQMAVRGITEDTAPTKHAVSVDWFRRDPGGSTIFVMPATPDGDTPQPATVDGDSAAAQG